MGILETTKESKVISILDVYRKKAIKTIKYPLIKEKGMLKEVAFELRSVPKEYACFEHDIGSVRFSHTVGKKPFGLTFLMWYVKKVILACETNAAVYGKLINVLQLKAHPFTLFSPATLKAVLFQPKS